MNGAMKAGDFKPCRICGKGVAHTNVPLFWRVRIERMGIDARAVQRTAGMELFMGGNVALARAFEDPAIASPICDAVEILICERCALEDQRPVALLAEVS